jgi:hypothetical protein
MEQQANILKELYNCRTFLPTVSVLRFWGVPIPCDEEVTPLQNTGQALADLKHVILSLDNFFQSIQPALRAFSGGSEWEGHRAALQNAFPNILS